MAACIYTRTHAQTHKHAQLHTPTHVYTHAHTQLITEYKVACVPGDNFYLGAAKDEPELGGKS